MTGAIEPSQRLNIVVLPAWYPTPDQPVNGIFVRGQALAVQRCNAVVVIADAGSDANIRGLFQVADGHEDGLRVFRVFYRRLPLLDAVGYLLAIDRVLRRLRREGRPTDVIHAHVYRAGWAAVLIGAVHRLPVVITEHSTEFVRRTLTPGARRRAAFAFRRADLVCPVSHDLQRRIEEYGLRARFEVVPNQVDIDRFTPREVPAPRPPLRLLNVAMHDPKKGLTDLLEAFARLEPARADLRLDLVGDGPQDAELRARASRLGISGHVVFHGVQTPEQIARLMRESHVFVLPSLLENLPVAIIEAQASGLPVVATTVGGVPEMVTREAGVLVSPGDIDELTGALRKVIASLESYDRNAIAVSARDRWSYESLAARWDQIYRRILSRRRAA
jgi:glycosyltransferase involved in cell wall biosynthesis